MAVEADFASLAKHLADPVVIMDRRGRICFMNLRAERMLGGGLKQRLEAHLNNQPQRPAISQVRFHLDGGADLILKVRLSGMKWMGEEATQVSLKDVTAYVTSAQRSAQEVEEARRKLEETQNRSGEIEAQLKEITANRDRVEIQLESALGRLRQAQEERRQFEQQTVEARQAADQLKAARQELEESQKQIELFRQEAGLSRQTRAENERLRQEADEALRAREQSAAQLQKEAVERAAAQAEAQRLREENEKLRQKIAATLPAEGASSEAQEWPDESDPLRVGKVEKASAKRRRELESNGATGAT
jgi:chromosome segregation ATPase